MGNILTRLFELLPEYSYKQRLREFLAFSPLVPKSIQDLSPIKGYEMYKKLQPGDIVVDAGAYPGDYTIYAARKVGSTGYVIAFEPDAKNRRVLERNIKAFKLKNVIIVPKGLYDRNGTLRLELDGLHSTENKQGEFIEVCRLDDELKEMRISKVDVIKMDIEGAEVKAILGGAIETIRNNNVYCAIAAYHPWDVCPILMTAVPLHLFFTREGYTAKPDYPKHTTLFAWKNGITDLSLESCNEDLNSSYILK